ncbi:hypothetical protein Pan97_42390 [Bremerella volcania]|uniref:DUF4013 domain-containing protein n=1 Tax=Bremerella volcania TaxID=2527984 RepID=A0A518CD76_9BACT|nr:DUF4013 domain-containing protein [Bremerella volcania]QDU77177.1 hypothetical protein Pan97_42390 [Bremerella volcania]
MSVVNSTWHDEALVPSEELVAPIDEACPGHDSETLVEAAQPPKKNIVWRIADGLMSAWEWCFGVVSMIVILAFLATVPILNLMSLGYLLEVSGRIARTGKFTQGFVGIRKAARIGSIVAGAWLMFLPLRLLSDAWQSAWLIDPQSVQTRNLWIVTMVATVAVSLHVAWACYRGGRLRHFIWPAPVKFFKTIFHGGMYAQAREGTLAFIKELHLWYYFSLGARGFVGTLLWLLVPVVWMIGARQINDPGAAFVVSLPGMLVFAFVLLYLPFLQARFAAENRFKALFEVRAIRGLFRQAPLAWWLALFITLLFALPLYLLKIEMIDREIAWLPSLFFVIFIFPARMLSGWAVAVSKKREKPAHFVWRWMSRLAAIPVVVSYIFFMYLFLYISWRGADSLLEQHAFLVPVPFLGA